MPTLADMISDIADNIDDTTGEYSSQTRSAILAAIRYCERKTYYFNQTRDVTFQTVEGQAWYGATANANIPTLIQIQEAYSEDSNGERVGLRREQPADIEILSDNSASSGEPFCYTYFNQQIRLYPIPGSAVYTIRLQLGPYRLAPLTMDASSNAWTTEAYDMVKARAKYILQKDTLKDATLAIEAMNDYNDQELALADETSRRQSRGRITATDF
jgi:hypothetical protein